jgi:hypothetical protein
MAQANHAQNEENFQELLPHFFYNMKTEFRIGAAYEASKNGYFHGMKLDEYGRHWIEIPKSPANDLAWHKWKSQTLSTAEEKDQDWKVSITYEEFSNGKDSSGQKIFKRARKAGVISSELLDEINALKDKSSFIWGCISRNPVDYVFASTEQSFNSCLSLDSNHSNAYYMSLPAMILDPHRALFFVTDKKWKRVEVKDIEFERYKIIQRAWVLNLFPKNLHEHTPLKKLWIDKTYPSEKYLWSSILPEVKIPSFCTYRSTPFQLGRFEDDQEAMIYLDCARLKRVSSGRVQYQGDGYGAGHFSPNFDWKGGFHDLSDIEDLTESKVQCRACSERLDHEETYFFDGDAYCQECYSERFTYCNECGKEIHREDMVSDDERDMCQDCFRINFFRCSECGRITPDEENQDDMCEDCFATHSEECESCGDRESAREVVSVEGDILCSSCYRDKTSECVGCGERFYDTNLKNLDAGKVCDNCLSDFLTECDECGMEYETEAAIYKTTCGNFCVHCVQENFILEQTDEEYIIGQYKALPKGERLPASAWLNLHPQWKALEEFLNKEQILCTFHCNMVERREALPEESFDKPSNLLKYCFSYAFERQEGFTNEKYEFWYVIHQRLLDDNS